MGAGASNTQKTGNTNVDKTVTRLSIVGAFKTAPNASLIVKPTAKKTHTREDIYEFVKSQKSSKEEAWETHQTEDKRRVSLLPGEEDKNEEQKGLYDVIIQEEDKLIHNFCGVCGKPTKVTVDGFPCRVCGQTYHKNCLSKCGRYSKKDMKMYDRANTPVGWSCEHCDNICNLLTEDEVEKLADAFEEFDKNKDLSVSLDEYLAFKKRQWTEIDSQSMSEEEEQFQTQQFHMLDTDGSGEIDYWEFLKNEACRTLAQRPKEELVGLLTTLEKQSARLLYNVLDIDGDGVITEDEAHKAFRSWYKHLDYISKTNKRLTTGKKGHENLPISFHATMATQHILDADENKDRVITWEEFLRNQALYILSSRPNKVNLT